MNVDENAKYSSQFDGTQYYFCSEKCFSKFTASPQSYLHQDSTDDCCAVNQEILNEAAIDAIYTCPMHP